MRVALWPCRLTLGAVLGGACVVGVALAVRPPASPTAAFTSTTSTSCDSLRPYGVARDTIRVLWIGTSLTAGFGVPTDSAFPGLVTLLALREDVRLAGVVAARGGATVDGTLAVLREHAEHPFQVVVLELGVNEAMSGLPPSLVRERLLAVLERSRALWPGAELLLVSTGVGPWHGDEYREDFEAIYTELAAETGAALVPPVLEGIGLEPEYTVYDELHPNAAGHRIIAERVWEVLRRRICDSALRVPSPPNDRL